MKRVLYKILIGSSVLASLIVAARLLGFYHIYNIPTSAMCPTLNPGMHILTLKFIKPKTGQPYCFKFNMGDKPETVVKRVAGVENDTIQVIEGYVYVNGKLLDKDYELSFPFTREMNADSLKNSTPVDEIINYLQVDQNTFIEFVPEKFAIKNKMPAAKRLMDSLFIDPSMLYNPDNANWTAGNYGPVVVPEGKYFMIGDNRYNSYDSRYFGFVDKLDMKEGVLFIINF